MLERLEKYEGIDMDRQRHPSNPCFTVRDIIKLANEVADLKRFLDAAITDARYFENQRDELMDQLECIVDGCSIKNNDEMPIIMNDARKLIKRLKV